MEFVPCVQGAKGIYKEDAGCTLTKDDAGSTYIAGKLKEARSGRTEGCALSVS